MSKLYDWSKGDWISPERGKEEWNHDWSRLFKPDGSRAEFKPGIAHVIQFFHIIKGQWINAVRALGIEGDRDKSQKIGGALNIVFLIAVIGGIGWVSF